jgi:predicted  nucleic acid-binding Zn-ribbon protein
MPWLRYHYHCEACDGSWLAEGDVALEADCPFCGTRDIFAYKSDERVHSERGIAERGETEDAATVAKTLAARMRKAVAMPRPATRQGGRLKRAG